MIMAKVKDSEKFDITVGKKEFNNIKLMGVMGPLKQYGNKSGYIICISTDNDPFDGIFSMFKTDEKVPQKLAVVYATGEFAEAVKKSPDQVTKLEKAVEIQCSDGNWNYDSYMHGMANGMIFSLAVIKGTEPVFKEAPKEWMRVNEGAGVPEMYIKTNG